MHTCQYLASPSNGGDATTRSADRRGRRHRRRRKPRRKTTENYVNYGRSHHSSPWPTLHPKAEEQERRSTYSGYKNNLAAVRAAEWWHGVARRDDFRSRADSKGDRPRENLYWTTLGHIKHFLSGVFRYAPRQGVLDNPSPMREVELPHARPAGETYAYSLQKGAQMLVIHSEPDAFRRLATIWTDSTFPTR